MEAIRETNTNQAGYFEYSSVEILYFEYSFVVRILL